MLLSLPPSLPLSLPSYDLLCEDDPDDFVAVEIPSDADSDSALLELMEIHRKGRFLDKLRSNRSMAGVTVITGGRQRSRAKMQAEKVQALHELADNEARVMQGGDEGEEGEESSEESSSSTGTDGDSLPVSPCDCVVFELSRDSYRRAGGSPDHPQSPGIPPPPPKKKKDAHFFV